MKKQAKQHQQSRQNRAQRRAQRAREVARERRSRPSRPGQLLSHVPQAVEDYGLDLLRSLDGMAGLRAGLSEIARERGDWAGIPMPMEGSPLVIEPTYPKAAELMAISRGEEPEEPVEDGCSIVNRWYSIRKGRDVVIFLDSVGKRDWGMLGRVNHAHMQLLTLGASDAWGIEQEARAVRLLGSMLKHRQFKQYLLTGMFLERSPRSGVHYMFRKLRPTLAIREDKGDLRILCALCLHPIAYYEGSWAGGMCPTDDVIAHLSLMRGDEHMLWRRANQHPAWRPEAGL